MGSLDYVGRDCKEFCSGRLLKVSHGEVTPLSSRTLRARQKKSTFLSCITKMDQFFYQFFFMSRYTQYLLHTKNS